MSRVIGVVTILDRTIELTQQEPGYGRAFGFCVPDLPDAVRNCTGFDTVGQALDEALYRMGLYTP